MSGASTSHCASVRTCGLLSLIISDRWSSTQELTGLSSATPAGQLARVLAEPDEQHHRQGEFRDRTFENQGFRASGLSLVTAAIVHWNTTYLDLAVRRLRTEGVAVPDELLA